MQQKEQIQKPFLKAICVLAICTYFASCASTDPDANRVINPQSLANVGPLISLEEREKKTAEPMPVVIKRQQQVKESNEGVSKSPANPDVKAEVELESLKPEAKAEVAKQALPVSSETPKAIEQTKATAPPVKRNSEMTQMPKPAVGSIQGRVVVLGQDQSAIEIKGSIVTLKHSNGALLQKRTHPIAHLVDMEDKTYLPRYLTVKASDNIGFVNKDKIKHNVFSSSGKNSFDLGTYGSGKQRNVSLAVEGVVKVYCNIHPEMASFVKVDTDGISTVANAKGEFSFEALEPGEYDLIVWHIRGEKTFKVTVESNKTASLVAALDTSNYEAEQRKNKFGLKYKTNTALFEDEFY